MNLFGPELERLLSLHGISKNEFATNAAIHRNQMTNICCGKANNPSKVDQIFAALQAYLTRDEHIGIAAKYLEDRRNDIGYDDTDIVIRRPDGKCTSVQRQRLLDIYDADEDVRKAIDAIVDVLSPAPAKWGTRSDANAAESSGGDYLTK